jgi:hypothetical protein
MKVVSKKLGREKAWGSALLDEKIIEIDPRLTGRKHLEILIHEALHILNPDWSEKEVIKQSKKLTHLLWKQHYRKVDNQKGLPLQ